MTIQEAIHKVITRAYNEVGYNEGADNWNKYAEDPAVSEALGWYAQNQPWCAIFIVWLFVKEFDTYPGKQMMYGCSAGCAVQASYYKENNAFYTTPQKGDQIFFYVNGGINHTGIVVDINGSTIETIEGNYSNGVRKNSYFINNSIIAGYGRPNWQIVADGEPEDPTDDKRDYPYLQYGDGIKNPKPIIAAWQNLMLAWGISVGSYGADGEFGNDTLNATKAFQALAGLEQDGIVYEDCWKEAIKVPAKN